MSLCLAAATVAIISCTVPHSQVSKPPHPMVLAQSSMKCGFAPFPPMGCKVGDCVCDQNGSNCQWTFVCN